MAISAGEAVYGENLEFPSWKRLAHSKRRASVRMLGSCARTGTQPFPRIPLRIEEVGRKLYLSETPSIGWEAKTLGVEGVTLFAGVR